MNKYLNVYIGVTRMNMESRKGADSNLTLKQQLDHESLHNLLTHLGNFKNLASSVR